MPWWKSIAREPLVHFVAIGAVLFAIDAWRGPAEPPETPPPVAPAPAPAKADPPDHRIVIDAAARAQIASNAQRRLGRTPTDAEVAAETELWIDEEVLYREAIARRLDRDDPMIHQRIAGRMSYVLEQSIATAEPTDAELRAWFDAHRDQWTVADHIDFIHVYVAGSDAASDARANELLASLTAGAPPERLGDTFPGGRRYRGRKLTDLALQFGDEFVTGLATQPVGTWVKRRSRHGLHLVRVERVDAGMAADFEAARLDVRKQWIDERRARELTAALRRLRDGWTIERP